MNLTTDQAIEILGVLYCDEDPVRFRGEEWCVCGITCASDLPANARDVYLTYQGREPIRPIRGTLQGMVKDRLEMN